MKKRTIKRVALVLAASAAITLGSGVQAASDTTTSWNGSSYTRIVGPAAWAKFTYTISSERKGYYETQIKDPIRWYVRSSTFLAPGSHGSFTRKDGSKSAYWRAWIQNGRITVTA